MKVVQIGEARLSIGRAGKVTGIWLNLPDSICFTLYHCPDQGLVLGYYKDLSHSEACTAALSINASGLSLQYTDDKGEVHTKPIMGE